MAGSYEHITDEKGDLITNEDFIISIENLGDAYEMAKECWYIIQILSQGDKDKIGKARETMYRIFQQEHNR